MSLYQPVKYALCIILIIGLVVVIANLKPEFERSRSDTGRVVMLVLQLFVLVIGIVGSYRDNRQLLLTFAIILAILLIVVVVQNQNAAVIDWNPIDGKTLKPIQSRPERSRGNPSRGVGVYIIYEIKTLH